MIPGAFRFILPLLLVAAALCGCQPKPEATAKQLSNEIRSYKDHPTTENRARVESTLAKFDRELALLSKKVQDTPEAGRAEAEAELKDLRRRRVELVVDFQAGKLNQLLEDGKSAAKNLGDSIGAGLGEIGKAIKGTNEDETSK